PIMTKPRKPSIDEALGRFLDGEPQPGDEESLVEAMRRDERFAREFRRYLVVDDPLRGAEGPDDHSFVESFTLRLSAESDKDAFVQEFLRRTRGSVGVASRRRRWRSGSIAAAVCAIGALVAGYVSSSRPGAVPDIPRPTAVARPVPGNPHRRDTPGKTFAVL